MKKLGYLILLVAFVFFMGTMAYAHSGRTDAYGGHKDNKNVSGVGSYHFHCDGHPAHLHTNGVCPYAIATTEVSTATEEPAETATYEPTTLPQTGEKGTDIKYAIIAFALALFGSFLLVVSKRRLN